MKVLIVEDEIIVNYDTKIQLLRNGYIVTDLVRKGENVLHSVMMNTPDVILLDIELDDDVSGIEVAKVINRHYPEINIIFASGSNIHDNSLEGIHYVGFLIKPYTMKDFEEIVEKIGVKA